MDENLNSISPFPNRKYPLLNLNQIAKGNGINGFLEGVGKETVKCFHRCFK